MRTRLLLGLLGILLTACGKKAADSTPPPPQPATGAPIAFVEKGLKPGANRGGEVAVKAYNFADKPVAQYMLLFRYYDKAGKVLKVKAGTPFEKEFDFMSLSGIKYKCAAKSWCGFTVDNLDVPADAARADVLASRVTALKDDIHFEDKPMFSLDNAMEWPGEKPAEDKPAEPAGSAAPAAEGSAAPAGSAEGSAAAPEGSAAP
jgi:hypothetical protein